MSDIIYAYIQSRRTGTNMGSDILTKRSAECPVAAVVNTFESRSAWTRHHGAPSVRARMYVTTWSGTERSVSFEKCLA